MDRTEGYDDRADAGRRLAEALERELPDPGDAVVLALPRGGLPVAQEVARRLDLPMDVLIVRKLGLPMQPELAMGAIASGGGRVLNREVITSARMDDPAIEAVEKSERRELERREQAYRGERPFPTLQDRTVILVDDGMATGSTIRAAVQTVRTRDPERIVVAVPTGPPDGVRKLQDEADLVVCPLTPQPFLAIGTWYRKFDQLTDAQVTEILHRAWSEQDG